MKVIPFAIAVIYGFIMRFVFGFADGFLQVLSIGFVFAVPIGIGALTLVFSHKDKRRSMAYAFFAPWLSVLGLLVLTILAAVEGWICWVIMFPIFAILAGFGGLIMRWWFLKNIRDDQSNDEDMHDRETLDEGEHFRNKDQVPAIILMLFPFLVGGLEYNVDFQAKTYHIHTFTDIHSSDTTIWANIVRVRPIEPHEENRGVNAFLGMPRPIRAELDTLAVGGRRRAIFDKGLVFDEIVFSYHHLREMAFSIDADPNEIPATAMDEHIVIGGKYFDVLEGQYHLEPIPDGRTFRVHLSSKFILDSPMNWYAGFWAQWIMKDIQENILTVLKKRSEE